MEDLPENVDDLRRIMIADRQRFNEAVKEAVEKAVNEAIVIERVRAAAVENAYKTMLDAKDKTVVEMRNKLSSTLKTLDDKSKELTVLRCELLRRAHLCAPKNCALQAMIKPNVFF